jgi:hypothetical protein
MDKGFNDQELTDILNEIEALEEEFGEEEDSASVQASAIMEELADMEEEKSIPVTNQHDSTVLPFEKKMASQVSKSGGTSSMMFKVQGDLNLELQFDIGGKTITLEVSEAGLNIQMEGGVTFFVPVSDAHSHKKAV